MSDETAPRAAVQENSIESQVERLARLQGTDPGLFVLAVHAFVEAWLRARVSVPEPTTHVFQKLVDAYIEREERRLGRFDPRLRVFKRLLESHWLTNQVRHQFATVQVEAAEMTTAQFKEFCQVVRIPRGEALARLERYIAAWDERAPIGAYVEENRRLRELQAKTAAEARQELERQARLEAAEAEAAAAGARYEEAARRIAELEGRVGAKDAKYDELRRKAREDRLAAEAELEAIREKLAGFEDQAEYVELLSKMTDYTRTRADYERAVIRLSEEQKAVLKQIRLDRDFLVKGAAGTGKTLVLLKAVEKAKAGAASGELGMEELSGSIALLTYTTTLVKYDAWLASLIALDEGDRIATASKFLVDRFRELEPKARVDYEAARDLAAKVPFPPIDAKDLAAEAETFVWGNLVTREEYVDACIDRAGMKKPIPKSLRAEVWDAIESLERIMRDSRRFSTNLAARDIVSAAAAGDARLSKVDYVFVDEAQDLSAAVLGALRASARKCAVLAGDGDQSLYQPFISFRRAGIDISGRTRVLKTNFRNTIQLHEFAERYRAKCPGLDAETQPAAYRPGPAPELVLAADLSGALELVVARVETAVKRLKYDPENLCVLARTNDELSAAAAALSKRGYATSLIKDEGFSFDERGSVRLCTMHSAKGLDFPVAIVLADKVFGTDPGWDEAAVERQARNLFYVAITRAMDHCVVIAREGATNPAVVDLVKAARG